MHTVQLSNTRGSDPLHNTIVHSLRILVSLERSLSLSLLTHIQGSSLSCTHRIRLHRCVAIFHRGRSILMQHRSAVAACTLIMASSRERTDLQATKTALLLDRRHTADGLAHLGRLYQEVVVLQACITSPGTSAPQPYHAPPRARSCTQHHAFVLSLSLSCSLSANAHRVHVASSRGVRVWQQAHQTIPYAR